MQYALTVYSFWAEGDSGMQMKTNIDYLNECLADGWKVVSSNPMGAYGYCGAGGGTDWGESDHGFMSLVILEK